MAGDGYKFDSLRPKRLEGERIALALALSLLAHVLIFGGYVLSRQIPALRHVLWLPVAKQAPRIVVQKEEQPLEFVTVQNPSTEAPRNDTKYFSNHNSIAANPDIDEITGQPKLDGKQTEVPDTHNEPRYQPSKSPTGADQKQENNSQASEQPKPNQSAGDLTLGKPTEPTTQDQPRPRTLKQAHQEMKNLIPSMTMEQSGGVDHRASISSYDVKLTGFGDYDAQFIDTVRENWLNALDSHKFALDRTGEVVLLFQLNYDGTISQMRVAGSSVGDLLTYVCEKAVLDGAPYQPWTEDMRRNLGDHGDMKFTFYYRTDE